ncbi:phage antirepressor N-terminal domain-containing protein [Shewanella xiamenensis]|uniref:phage antirepressor N-terminal domain-containing protein n=1 Tax=Shewanella xiamenensis TaxID=332186 RepID=UPI0021C1F677|nr:phage antirepressor N-terminal domain-containing protein [Shewanella xiamenensis]MCT8876641.1 phage antirepressor N-terminal domain-containing protein [Shewanella xiamenensis]
MKQDQQTIRVAHTEITVIESDNQQWVAIKPICDALGLHITTQRNKLVKDYDLKKMINTCANGKKYNMDHINYSDLYSWLIQINFNKLNAITQEHLSELLTSMTGRVFMPSRFEFKFEQLIKQLFNGFTIIPQWHTTDDEGSMYIDWYIPELSLAVEYNEHYHLSQSQTELDDDRHQRVLYSIFDQRDSRFSPLLYVVDQGRESRSIIELENILNKRLRESHAFNWITVIGGTNIDVIKAYGSLYNEAA